MTAVVIGVGNDYRHDDGVGPEVVRRLRRRHLPGVTLAITDGEPSRLLDLWDQAEVAVVVDAVRTEASTPGKIHEMVVDGPVVAAAHTASSHGLGLGEAVDLALALQRMPERLVLLVIEGADFTVGAGLSPAVMTRMPELVERIAAAVS